MPRYRMTRSESCAPASRTALAIRRLFSSPSRESLTHSPEHPCDLTYMNQESLLAELPCASSRSSRLTCASSMRSASFLPIDDCPPLFGEPNVRVDRSGRDFISPSPHHS